MVSNLLTSTQIIYVLFCLGIIQYIFINNCQCVSNHYFISNNGSSYSSSNSISLNNYGNSLTIEPAYDIKCKEENTVDNEVCAKFSIGDENQGFIYSPNYPNNYPNTTECARCIEAPHGRFIKIEFRDSFNMEESASCEYDKLEIRNGKFGYSDLLATLCGHDFPNEISSSDRFLWLRFKSDESIEYPGFKIFYQFIPLASPKPIPPRDCSDDIRGQSSGFISQENISIENIEYSNKHNAPLECVWTIEVEPKNKMYVNFLQYTLEKPNDCEMNYIDIYEENFNEEKRKQRFCGTSTEPFKSDGNKVRIRFHAKPGALRAKFSLLYTSFRETQNKEKCNPATEFDCNDGTCIDIKLKCNDEHNCKYRYDEDKSLCQTDGSGLASLADNHMIVILVVFFALVIGMCASIVVSCWGKIQERRQREIDYKMRVSSHPSLDAIDRINLVLGSKQHLPSAGFNPTAAQQQQMLNARYKHHLLLNSRNNSEEADADAMLNSLAKEEQDDEEGCYLPELDGSLLILDESNSYSDQVHTHPSSVAPTASRMHLRNAPQVQHSINSQNTDLISPTDSCPLFYHLHRPPTANSGNIHLLQQQASQTQTESLKSGSNDSESPIPPPPPPPTFSHLRQRQIAAAQAASQSQRQTPVSNLSANHNHYSSSGSQPDLSKLIDNQRANLAHSMHHYPASQSHFQHYIPNANSYRAISPTQQTSAILDDFYHQHAFQIPNGSLHNAVSHPYLAQTAKNQNRDILHLSQHNLNSHPSLQHSQYNSRQRLLQPQSSQQSNHELSNTNKTNVHHHHPDCAAVVKSSGHFYQHNSPIKHTPSHKINTNQNFQNKQLLDEDSIDEIGNQNYPIVRRHPTMHNQTQLFGMSKPSNLINSSQDEECCESDLASINGNQDNGHLNRALDYADENEEEDVIEEDLVPHHALTQKRPQIRTQFSSNSNNDSNESGVGGDLSAQLNGSQSERSLAGLNDEKFVPLSANRLQQCYSKFGSTRAEINEVGGSNTANSSLTPSQQTQNSQQLQQQRNFVETHCAPDAVVLR